MRLLSFIDDESKDDDRHRNRIRARIGVKAKMNDEVDLGFQMASGSSAEVDSDPASTNQTLDNGFSSKNIWLDLAYADYHPNAIEGLHLLAGKMKNPFYKPGKAELIWDGDLNPEGGAIKYEHAFDDDTAVFANAGGFWIEESSSNADSGLFGAQLGLRQDFDSVSILGGVSYFHFGNTEGEPFFFEDDSFGNTGDGDGNYKEDFEDVEVFAELGFALADVPISVYGDYVNNVAADGSDDTGWLVGITAKPAPFELRYNYRDIEADAVLGLFTDSDFRGGGTDGKGHEFGLGYEIAKNWTTALTYFHNEKGLHDSKDYQRLQADVQFKF